MRGAVKQEPSASRRTRVTLRHTTPVSFADTVNMEVEPAAQGHDPDSVPTASTSTGTTLSGDVDMEDTAPDALYHLGRKGRELIQGIQKLESLGINTTIPSLPKVVVIGDQSAGKSSIIEAICDVTLPRSEGTCTRCPFMLTTTAAAEDAQRWSCKVSLVNKYEPSPHHKGDASSFDGWKKKSQPECSNFASVTDKMDLELVLRRAQLAILNPLANWKKFLSLSATEVEAANCAVSFSPNIISLEITAPGLLNLSFYDLPGAINVLPDEKDDHLPPFIEKLIKSYLMDEQALIVIATPANQDGETGTSMRFLRECKAVKRATGVLTKPDLVESGKSLEKLGGFFHGTWYPLGGGWYATRQLSQAQLDGQRPSYEEARLEESRFFSQRPWSTTLSAYAHRFGVGNLQEAISDKHLKHIKASLPDIIDRVKSKLDQVQQELESFPTKAVTPGLEIICDIDHIMKAINSQCSAEHETSPLRTNQGANINDLLERLRAARPKVEMKTPGYVRPSLDPIDITSGSEPDETPSKRSKGRDGRAVSVTPRLSTPANNRNMTTPLSTNRKRKANQSSPGSSASTGVVFLLDEVKQRYDHASSATVPDFADPRITNEFATKAMGSFSNLTQQGLDKFETLFKEMLDDCLAQALVARKGTILHANATDIMRELFNELFDKVSQTIHEQIACLIRKPMALSTKWWSARRAEVHQKLVRGRTETRVLEYYEVLESKKVKGIPTTIPERKKKAADPTWVQANLRSPSYQRELHELAMPLTFYDLAHLQLTDLVARNLDYLIYQFEDSLKTRLLGGLRPHDPEHAASLLAEDPQREATRAALEAEAAKLEVALMELEALA